MADEKQAQAQASPNDALVALLTRIDTRLNALETGKKAPASKQAKAPTHKLEFATVSVVLGDKEGKPVKVYSIPFSKDTDNTKRFTLSDKDSPILAQIYTRTTHTTYKA